MPAALGLDDPVLDLVAHPEPVAAADGVGVDDELDLVGELLAVDGHGPPPSKRTGDVLGGDLDVGSPVGHAHDRLDDLHPGGQLLERLGLVGGAPDVGVRRVRLLLRVPVRQVAGDQELAHLGPPAELVDELLVEPRLVDPQRRVDEQPVAVEALDVVALVGAAVAPDVDAVVVHRPHQQRPGDGPAQRRRVEVRLAGRRDVERPALQRHQALADQLGAAVDDAGRLGPVLPGPLGHALEVGLVGLTEVGGVGVGDRALVAHPGHRRRRVEATGEGDADPFTDGQRRQDFAHRRRSYRPTARWAAVPAATVGARSGRGRRGRRRSGRRR